jgi:phosphoribosylamine---glycine ligase
MKILVVGSGGREHALIWKLKQSPKVEEIYCAPGNAGIAELAVCVDIAATDIDGLVVFAHGNGIELTVVGPELPLTLGIVDRFSREGLSIFGPSREAAALEGSKVFTKRLLARYGIPSAHYETFDNREDACRYLKGLKMPVVVKADGLAAGKGVIIAHSSEEAVEAVELIMAEKAFGDAGDRLIIEEFLTGEEASFIAFTDGNTVLPLPTSQDHKAIYDGDRGPNTGGMGAYSPAPVVTEELHRQVMEQVMLPVVRGMAAEGRPYKGVLYAGLMIEEGVAKVLEFNCRFGDPEAQPLLMRLRSDLVDLMTAVIEERLHEIQLEIDPRPAVCVVMAAEGYPDSYRKGDEISGLPEARKVEEVEVFHAGTVQQGDKVVTAGGRVLGVTALGEDLSAAIGFVYKAVNRIKWQGCYFRRDIGQKALRRRSGSAED